MVIKKLLGENYNLFLDDFRFPETAFNYMHDPVYLKEQWKIARNYSEFCCMIDEHGIPQKVSYDHDLAPEHYAPEMYHGQDRYNEVAANFQEKTGLDCARYLVEKSQESDIPHPEYLIHSMNPAGKKNIQDLIKSYNDNR